ncbi:MAG TPA: YicC family protein [Cytophagales bacterium]|nr:YicC family protein [Cytophagales bacterium]HAP63369.1 YicC family protein [Cytophagales bacterium]
MIHSMTGYGKSVLDTEAVSITVEVKTLNSKYLDANIRIPRSFSEKELEIRNLLSEHLQRGKVSLSVEYKRHQADLGVVVNEDLFKAYFKEFSRLANDVQASGQDLFKLALQAPEVMNGSDQGVPDEDWLALRAEIVKALKRCNEHRASEGAGLAEKLSSYIEAIGKNLQGVEEQDPHRTAHIREKLRTHMNEWISDERVDENRFEQELIYYIEKLDIAEEKVRLQSHLNYFMEIMNQGKAPGKKLGFIAQEIGREINTMGAKANDAVIQKLVVGMKEELEKIKEQSLNIL